MSDDDRQRWNRKYAAGSHGGTVSAFLEASRGYLPESGRALDVAGGAGRNAVWLAGQGFETTLIDVSDEAIGAARARADAAGVPLRCERVDLESASLPAGPWEVIVCFHYLQRDLFPAFAAGLATAGVLVFAQPTARNLERNPKPSRRFLLEEGELAGLIDAAGLEAVSLEEGWGAEGRHEARVIATLRK